ncbi:hypothetical protein J1614_000032 [Plenodomus biglobosus]|nr:hypothetical protein J1614_000032 [Plenodomus biglobosus]
MPGCLLEQLLPDLATDEESEAVVQKSLITKFAALKDRVWRTVEDQRIVIDPSRYARMGTTADQNHGVHEEDGIPGSLRGAVQWLNRRSR